MGPIIGAVAIFIIAALLYYQSHAASEGFQNPVAGRPYGAVGELADAKWKIPADLNRAPVADPYVARVPSSQRRPVKIPGAPTAPREAMAEKKDLHELDSKITTWLFAASQREAEHPGSLTPDQLQRRIILQARLASVRTQLTNDMITDTYKQVSQEILELRRENAGWGRMTPSLEAVHTFAAGTAPDALLIADQYKEFRGLFDTVLNEYRGHTQPNPLENVRLQQLELLQQDLLAAEREFHPPPIRAGVARLFLQQALRPDQPLPTLFSMEPRQQTPLAARPVDVIGQLRDIEWRLTVMYDPAGQELKRQVAALLQRLQTGNAPPDLVEGARATVANLTHRLGPAGSSVSGAPISAWDPSQLQQRARRLCTQIHEAFPQDAEALGCPPADQPITTDYEAESAINIVCERLHYSVPSVSPAQFACPPRPV